MKQQILVLGLGRFGSSVARTLQELGQEVLGIDVDGRLVEEMKHVVTHVAQGDATDPNLLAALDIEQFEAAVVAIGNNFEANVLTSLALRKLNVPYVMAKALSAQQVEVLRLIGVDHVAFPDADAGQLAAYQLVNRHLVGFLRLDGNMTVAALEVGSWAGKVAGELELKSDLCLLAIYRNGKVRPLGPDEPLAPDDYVLLAGTERELRNLARLR